MGNSETKDLKSVQSQNPYFSWNVYLCRNRSIFDKPHTAWLEFHDVFKKGNIFCYGPNVRHYKKIDPSCTLRILSGRISNIRPVDIRRVCAKHLTRVRTEEAERKRKIPEENGEEEVVVEVEEEEIEKEEPLSFACGVLQELKLPWRNEIYICRKRDKNFHVWVEFCSPTSRTEKVHKFHLQFIGRKGRKGGGNDSKCRLSSSTLADNIASDSKASRVRNDVGMEVMEVPVGNPASDASNKRYRVHQTREGYNLINNEDEEDEKEDEEEEEEVEEEEEDGKGDFVMVEKPLYREKLGKFVDRHKILNPPGESNSYKVAVGFTNCTIPEIVLVSNRVIEMLNKNRTKLKPVKNCRTYILHLLDEIGLSSFQSRRALVSKLKSVWGSGKDIDWIKTFGGIGAATGIIGTSLVVGAAGIIICGVFIWNPAMETVGVGMVALGALGLVGTPVAISIGGLGGGIAGSGLSAFTLREIDRRFKTAKGKDVLFVEKTEDEEEREWIEVVLRDEPPQPNSEDLLHRREEIEKKKREGHNSSFPPMNKKKDEQEE